MASPVFLYRVFIASPGGLEPERKAIVKALDEYNKTHGLQLGLIFHPIIWEDALPTMARPQSHLNKKLRECDFFILILWERWGSAPDNKSQQKYSSGSEEEFREAVSCLASDSYPMRDIAVFFKGVDPQKLMDPGPQLNSVLNFQRELEETKELFFRLFSDISGFSSMLRRMLPEWARLILRDSDSLHADPGDNMLQYTGDRLSLDFQHISISTVLQLLSDFSGLNMVISDTITGHISIKLKNVPWDQALGIILRSKGLDMQQEGNAIWIAPIEELAARERLAVELELHRREMRKLLNKD